MISKELFSDVLKEYVKDVYEIGSNPNFKDNTLLFSLNGCGELCDINIYELVHECKVWAKNKGYVVGTDLDKVNVWSIKERIIVNHFEVYFEDYLEFEIKACQWIFDNETYKEEI